MKVVVVDASALVEYLLGTEASEPIRDIVRSEQTDLHVPALCDVEVAAGLRRARLRGWLSGGRLADALEDYLDLPLIRHGHRALLPRVLEPGANFSAYDATYVALAEQIGGDLLTADERLRSAVRSHSAIRVLPDPSNQAPSSRR